MVEMTEKVCGKEQEHKCIIIIIIGTQSTERILTVQHSTCNRRISKIIREALGVIPLAEQGHVMQRTAMGKCKLGEKQNSQFFLNVTLFFQNIVTKICSFSYIPPHSADSITKQLQDAKLFSTKFGI